MSDEEKLKRAEDIIAFARMLLRYDADDGIVFIGAKQFQRTLIHAIKGFTFSEDNERAAMVARVDELEETVRLRDEKLGLEAETISLNHEASKRDWVEISDLKAEIEALKAQVQRFRDCNNVVSAGYGTERVRAEQAEAKIERLKDGALKLSDMWGERADKAESRVKELLILYDTMTEAHASVESQLFEAEERYTRKTRRGNQEKRADKAEARVLTLEAAMKEISKKTRYNTTDRLDSAVAAIANEALQKDGGMP